MWAPLDHFCVARVAISRCGLAVALFSVNLLCASAIYSQRQLTSFGRQTELSLGFRPASVMLSPLDAGQPRLVVVSERERPFLHFYRVASDGTIEEQRRLEAPVPLQSIRSLAKGRVVTYMGLSREGDSLVILKESRSRVRTHLVHLPTQSQRFFVTDLNNDGWPDFVLFGRTSAGLLTVLGGPRDTFAEGPLLFPEISASDAQSRDLNDDGITDLVLADWLTDQVSIFFGMGRGIFSEQISFALPGEPSDLALTGDIRKRTFSVAVAIPEQRSILTLEGNALGQLRLTGQMEVRGRATGLAYTSVNGDDFPDLVSATTQGILVALGVSSSEVGAPTYFGGGTSVAGWAVGDLDGDRENDLALVDDTTNRLVLLANATDAGSSSWPDVYAVGKGPRSIAAADLNGDGELDLAVANEVSSTLSVLRNKGKGIFAGQQSLTLADPPTALKVVAAPTTGTPLLIVSHQGTSRLSIIKSERRISDASTTTVTVCDNPLLLGATTSTHHHGLQLFVRCLDTRDGSQTLSVLDQLDGMNFLERSVQTVPYRTTALTITGLGRDGTHDFLFAAHDAPSKKTYVYTAHSRDSLTFASPRRLFGFPDTSRSVRGLLAGDINGDGMTDMIVPLGQPVNALVVAIGNSQGQGRESPYWIRAIHMDDPGSAVLTDVNRDGCDDLTYIDDAKGSVLTLYGRERERLSTPVTIWQGKTVRSLCIVSLRQPDASDLVLADAARGTVTILFNPFRE